LPTTPKLKGDKMANMVWIETESGSAYNSAVAASGTQEIVGSTQRVEYFNSFFIQNRDSTPIRIRLDNATYGNRVFEVQASGGILVLEPEDGIRFKQIVQENLDTVNAQTAGLILFRWARKERLL
jgi:hypothetical protein